MQNLFQAGSATLHMRTLTVAAALALVPGLALATPAIGYTSQSTRTAITSNLYASQWGSLPLFNFVMQSSGDQWGYDLIHATNTFPMPSADGTPSQSGSPCANRTGASDPGRYLDAGTRFADLPHLLSDRVHVRRKCRAFSQRLQFRHEDAWSDIGNLVCGSQPLQHSTRPTRPDHREPRPRVHTAGGIVPR